MTPEILHTTLVRSAKAETPSSPLPALPLGRGICGSPELTRVGVAAVVEDEARVGAGFGDGDGFGEQVGAVEQVEAHPELAEPANP
jgi:hypothetical protein